MSKKSKSKKSKSSQTLYLHVSKWNEASLTKLEELNEEELYVYTNKENAVSQFDKDYTNYLIEVKINKVYIDKVPLDSKLIEIKLK